MPRCSPCKRHFDTMRALHQHECNSLIHLMKVWDHVCVQCKTGFDTLEKMEEHHHEIHIYCTQHEIFFSNANNLRQHLRSTEHIGTSQKCPYCVHLCSTITAVVKHMESGACNGGINRRGVDKCVRDSGWRKKFLTNEWKLEQNIWASGQDWNGGVYECCLCANAYDDLSGLNGHITQKHAPRRERFMYQCMYCERVFKMFGDLVSHAQFTMTCEARDASGENSLYCCIDWN